jgi:histidinol-phosphate aminotransferase
MEASIQMLHPVHGGPDAQGVAPHDFSTNGNACGPCPLVVSALRAVEAAHYPDPRYTTLKERLARFHGVEASRIVIAASASEFIFRITSGIARRGGRSVSLPPHAYGDYARAAVAWGLQTRHASGTGRSDASLVWLCDPSSPLGQGDGDIGGIVDRLRKGAAAVLDLAYEPLRLKGSLALERRQRDRVWQMWTPNKALGLTGIRAAYAIAPVDDAGLAGELDSLAPSWPVGAHGVALLEAWADAPAQAWLAQTMQVLRGWKADQIALCESIGWSPQPSVANFLCVRLPGPDPAALLAHLRDHGIKLRDTASFGLPAHARLAVMPPESLRALRDALRSAPP